MSETITDDGSTPSTVHVHDPVKCGAWLDSLDFETRQRELEAFSSDEDRTKVIEALPPDTREKWAREELKHFQNQLGEQPVEGAEFAADPDETVKLDGADEPQDRAPDVGAELIAQLVKERIEWEQRALKAEKVVEDANAEVNAYYERFGPLGS